LASELIKAVRNQRNLERAWSVIQRNGRTSKSEEVRLELETFAEDAPSNLRSIKSRLGHNTFKFEPAKGVPIPKTDAQGKKQS
jgi:RNA-directed DNA polymerase